MPCIPGAAKELDGSNVQCETLQVRSCLSIAGTDVVPLGALTPGSIPFAGPTGALAQDNPHLFWENTGDRLGVGTNTPGMFGADPDLVPDTIAHFTRRGTLSNAFVLVEAGTALDAGIALFTDTTNEDVAMWIDHSDARKLKLSLGQIEDDAQRLASTKFTFTQTGRLGIGTTAPGFPLDVAGISQVVAEQLTNSATAVSDADTARLRYSDADAALQLSIDTGAYRDVPVLTAPITTGSVLFAASGRINQDNANLFWDDTNNRLGIGTAAPAQPLDVRMATATDGGVATIQNKAADGFSDILFNKSDNALQMAVGYGNAGVTIAHLANKMFVFAATSLDFCLANGTRSEHTFGMTSGSAFYQFAGGAGAALSAAGTARMIYDAGTNQVKVSKNGAAYAVLI